ncbi:MAG: hypothetical protein Kow00120_00310 [Anaerolineae bacterium]
MKTDNKGFHKVEGGALVVTSTHSVFGKKLTSGTVSVPVPGYSGVKALLTPGEHAELLARPELMEAIKTKAGEAFPAPVKVASRKD